MTQKTNHYILSGGGTGGHIYPAIAIAEELLKQPETSVHFVGALGKMEMEKIPKEGFEITGMPIRGFQRGKIFTNLKLPFLLVYSLIKSFFLLKKQKPKAVIGTGGYASAPVAMVASFLNIPVYLQEQNSFPGLVNRKVSKFAKYVFSAYPNMDKYFACEVVETGNPLRGKLIESIRSDETKSESSKKTILILGGSLGARSINSFFMDHLDQMRELKDIQWIWQCGKLYKSDCETAVNKSKSSNIELHDFIYNMPDVYAQADVIICRAGALTVSEIALINKPAIFIPSPNVTDNHQYKNAKVLADKGACRLIKEKELSEKFAEIVEFVYNTENQQAIKTELKAFSKPNASESIVKYILG